MKFSLLALMAIALPLCAASYCCCPNTFSLSRMSRSMVV